MSPAVACASVRTPAGSRASALNLLTSSSRNSFCTKYGTVPGGMCSWWGAVNSSVTGSTVDQNAASNGTARRSRGRTRSRSATGTRPDRHCSAIACVRFPRAGPGLIDILPMRRVAAASLRRAGGLPLRNRSELPHQGELVAGDPHLGDPPVGEPLDRDAADVERAPSRRQLAERAGVRPARPPARDDLVALGDLILDAAHRVGERRAVGGDEALRRLDPVRVAAGGSPAVRAR